MPKEFDNNNSGVLFKNTDKKDKDDKKPDYRGNAEVDGVQYWVSAWIKEGKKGGNMAGQKFLSMSFQVKDENGGKGSKDNDDIDF